MSTRRDLLLATEHAGVTPGDLASREDVARLVRAFYREAAVDDLLGPAFNAVHVDWSAHIPRLVDFWSWQLLGERGYDGHPIRAHQPANELVPFTDAHFRRWLEIFDSTVDDLFAGPTAELAKHRAAKIARAMQRSLGGRDPADSSASDTVRSVALDRSSVARRDD